MFTNVSPLTLKGRSPALWITGGGRPPRAPVKVWTLVPVAVAWVAVGEAALEAATAGVFVDVDVGLAASGGTDERLQAEPPVLVGTDPLA